MHCALCQLISADTHEILHKWGKAVFVCKHPKAPIAIWNLLIYKTILFPYIQDHFISLYTRPFKIYLYTRPIEIYLYTRPIRSQLSAHVPSAHRSSAHIICIKNRGGGGFNQSKSSSFAYSNFNQSKSSSFAYSNFIHHNVTLIMATFQPGYLCQMQTVKKIGKLNYKPPGLISFKPHVSMFIMNKVIAKTV